MRTNVNQPGDGSAQPISDEHIGAISEHAAAPSTAYWRTFTKFVDQFCLSVSPTSGEVKIRPPGLPLPAGFVDIDKMTEQDHRAIAAQFAATLDDELRPAFEDAAAAPEYWPKWKRLITKHKGTGVYGKWMGWRHRAITDVLIERLERAGVGPDRLPQVVETILESRGAEQALPSASQGSPSEIRALAHAVIDQLSDDELDRLRLLLGKVLNAQRQMQQSGS